MYVLLIGGVDMEDKTFQFLEMMYVEMQKGFKKVDERFDKVDGKFIEVDERFDKVEGRLDKIEGRMDRIEGRVTRIEQDHGKKLSLLFDGYKQNSDKLDRIEKEVTKQEEVILRRIK